jgi:dipeptide transport system ATP-binding protein
MSLFTVRNLRVAFGAAPAVDGIDLDVAAGEVVGIVGESGSGKSVAMMSVLGVADANARVAADSMTFDGRDLLALAERERRGIVGRDIAMVFQDAPASLDPSYTVGMQVGEVLGAHLGLRGRERDRRVVELLEMVEIPDAPRRARAWPHELSGGMAQRVMIAMAIACGPKLLIADEPTTALDVTIQAQVMALLLRLQREQGMALVLITHDLALVAEVAQRACVMYAGQIVESAALPALFESPRHPYTEALLAAIPEHNRGARRLLALPGVVPAPHERPRGCLLAPRCAYAQARCVNERPALEGGVRCFYPVGSVHAHA